VGMGLLMMETVFALAFVQQHYHAVLEPVIGNQLAGVVGTMPQLSYGVWVGVLLVFLFVYRSAARLKKRFAQREVRVPQARGVT
jgi:hypothetical protein